MRFWGWGREGHPRVLPDHALAFLADHVGVAPRRHPPRSSSRRCELPASRLPPPAEQALRAALGPDGLAGDHRTRVLHCAG